MVSEAMISVVLQLSTFYFCLVVGLFLIPLILERIIYHIPRLIMLTRVGDARKRSVPLTIGGTIVWICLVIAVYTLFYFSFPTAFYYVTVAPVALIAWGLSIVHLLYRLTHFNKTVKRNFYYKSYMHYITPEALQAYQVFIEDLDNMTNGQLEDQVRQGKNLPYMHKQALHRKLGERGIADIWEVYNRPLGLFAFLRLGNKKEKQSL